MTAALSVREALSVASALTLARWGGVVQLRTLDWAQFTAVVLDEAGDVVPDAPAASGAGALDAVGVLLEVLHNLNIDDALAAEAADPCAELAEAFPAGLSFSLVALDAPVVDRATGDVIVPRELCDICHERPVTLSPERAPYRYGCDACNDSVAPALAGGA